MPERIHDAPVDSTADVSARLGVSSRSGEGAWALTRALSPRPTVRVMARDAYGTFTENAYPLIRAVGPRAPDAPWAMHLASADGRYRVLCFDFDGKDSAGHALPDLMEQAQDDCDVLSNLLSDVAVSHLVCESSGGGGRHIWVNVRAGVDADLVKRLARAARANFGTLDHGMLCNPATGCARPPLSPHRDGSASRILRGEIDELLAATTPPSVLAELADVLDARRPSLRPHESVSPDLTVADHRAHRALSAAGAAHMATVNGGSNPSWTAFLCLMSAAAAGWSFADVEYAARTAPGMEHYRTKNTGRGTRVRRPEDEARARLERQWAKALAYTAVQSPLPRERDPEDLSDLERLVEDAATLQLLLQRHPGRWGASESAVSDRTVLIALAYLTLHTGKRVVAAAVRDLALITGLGRQTAAAALRRLAAAGHIARVAPDEGAHAARWALTVRTKTDPLHFSTVPGTLRTQPINNPRPPDLFNQRAILVAQFTTALTDARHDLFTRAGLGHLAGRTWAELRHHDSVTPSTLAKILGVTVRHAVTVLSRLRTARLIVKHADGWARSRRDGRDRAARSRGIDGYLADRADRYDVERQVWQWWQAELAVMHSIPRMRPRRPHATARPLFTDATPPQRTWPRYPRRDGLAHWRTARQLVADGALDPDARWKYLA